MEKAKFILLICVHIQVKNLLQKLERLMVKAGIDKIDLKINL